MSACGSWRWARMCAGTCPSASRRCSSATRTCCSGSTTWCGGGCGFPMLPASLRSPCLALLHQRDDLACGGYGVGGLGDRPTDDEVVGAARDGLVGSGGTFLVVPVAA